MINKFIIFLKLENIGMKNNNFNKNLEIEAFREIKVNVEEIFKKSENSSWSGVIYFCKGTLKYYKDFRYDKDKREECPNILLIVRNEGMSIPGGSIKYDEESPLEAANREILEELLVGYNDKKDKLFEKIQVTKKDFLIATETSNVNNTKHISYLFAKELNYDIYQMLLYRSQTSYQRSEILSVCSVPIYFERNSYSYSSAPIFEQFASLKFQINTKFVFYTLFWFDILNINDLNKFKTIYLKNLIKNLIECLNSKKHSY